MIKTPRKKPNEDSTRHHFFQSNFALPKGFPPPGRRASASKKTALSLPLSEKGKPLRNRVDPSFEKGIAAEDPLEGEIPAPKKAKPPDRLERVLRAGGVKPAARGL